LRNLSKSAQQFDQPISRNRKGKRVSVPKVDPDVPTCVVCLSGSNDADAHHQHPVHKTDRRTMKNSLPSSTLPTAPTLRVRVVCCEIPPVAAAARKGVSESGATAEGANEPRFGLLAHLHFSCDSLHCEQRLAISLAVREVARSRIWSSDRNRGSTTRGRARTGRSSFAFRGCLQVLH
jgi:hypothetical protein